MKMKYAEGGEVDNQRNKEIAQAILQQLGGGNRLIMMVGAYNFVIIPNGVAFRIKNAKANVIKITLNGLDLYNLEVGRVRGTTYKVVLKEENLYNDMLKPMIEKATGMYLSLYEKGGAMKNKMAKGGKTESKSVAVSKTISGNEINLFIDYCYGFYGKGGTYADELNGGLTKAQVKTAVMKYLDQLDSTPTWGGGDSLDRERVRLIFDKNYSLLKKGGKMAEGGKVEDRLFDKLKENGKLIRYIDVRGNGKKVFDIIVPNKNEKGMFKRYESLSKNTLGVLQNEFLDEEDVKRWIKKTSPNKMAKGGVTQHGLRKGDTITDDMFWSNEAIVRDAKGEKHKVDLDKGKRYERGGKMAKGEGVGSSDTPKIYVADLHAYNNGRLIGEWLDLGEYDNGEEVMEAIQQIVDKWKAKYGEEHEEFAIHDYENFSEDLYSEYMSEKSFDQVVKIYKISQEKGIPQEVLGSIAREYDVAGDDLEEWIDEHYEGQFDSDTDLAYNYVDMVGGVNELDKKTLENYFDYESFGRDLAYDYREFDGYYFRSYKRGGNIGKKYDLMKYLKMDSSGWNYSIGGL